MSKSYGTRNCLVCKREYEAKYASQLTCSEECRLKRELEFKRLYCREYRARKKAELLALKEMLEEKTAALKSAEESNAELKNELEKVKKELENCLSALKELERKPEVQKKKRGRAAKNNQAKTFKVGEEGPEVMLPQDQGGRTIELPAITDEFASQRKGKKVPCCVCGNDFVPATGNEIYCSVDCLLKGKENS